MSILFDPRDARCKSPFGAVTTFAAVDFTFCPCGHAVTGCEGAKKVPEKAGVPSSSVVERSSVSVQRSENSWWASSVQPVTACPRG